MTTRALFISSVVGVGFLFSLAVVVLMRPDTTAVPPPAPVTPMFPVGQPIPAEVVAGTALTVPLMNGNRQVRNFLNDPDVTADQSNLGFYYLNDTNATAPYIIQYIAQTGDFTVALTREPLGKARSEAEAYLTERLNITPADLCQLRHSVSVPANISAEYTSQELGFSACAGSVALP
ncbi:hypothetical protein K2Q16_04155 [Patescibacteria group bacterium]|nr:hypothetical protein [Patescibacteria group bacterium]